MIQTEQIDIKAVVDQLACIEWKKPVRSRGELIYKGGPCPFCNQGTDRFSLFVEGEKPHFYCGIHGTGCGAHGDVIKFVQLIKKYDRPGQAIRDLKDMGFEIGESSESSESTLMRVVRVSESSAPPAQWQESAKVFVSTAQKCLWSATGREQLDYLRGRGLTDESIKRFNLGYCPKWIKQSAAEWGLEGDDFWLRPGIIIPCFEGATLWYVNTRITEYTSNELMLKKSGRELPRYKKIKGSGNGLFNVDSVQTDQPLFIVEGEMCAMSLAQETGLPVVATGSTKGAQLSRWIATIALSSTVIVAFDSDGKGESAAQYWLDLFDGAMFYEPWSKDINDMLRDGLDIKAWSDLALELINPVQPEQQEEVYNPVCKCGISDQNDTGLGSVIETERGIQYLCSVCSQPHQATVQPETRPEQNAVVLAAASIFSAQITEIFPVADEQARIRAAALTEQLTEQQTEQRNSRPGHKEFDPMRPVDWTLYGYKRDQAGKWRYMRKDMRSNATA